MVWGSFGLLGLFQLACGLVVNQMLDAYKRLFDIDEFYYDNETDI